MCRVLTLIILIFWLWSLVWWQSSTAMAPVVKEAKATGLLGDIHCALKFLQDYYPRYRKPDTDRVLLFWALKYNLTNHYFINNKIVIQPSEVAKGIIPAGKVKGVWPAGKLKGAMKATIKLEWVINWGSFCMGVKILVMRCVSVYVWCWFARLIPLFKFWIFQFLLALMNVASFVWCWYFVIWFSQLMWRPSHLIPLFFLFNGLQVMPNSFRTYGQMVCKWVDMCNIWFPNHCVFFCCSTIHVYITLAVTQLHVLNQSIFYCSFQEKPDPDEFCTKQLHTPGAC